MKASDPYVHPIVKALAGNPAQPLDLAVIRGYIGPGDVGGITRVYLDAVLSQWRDIPDEQVLHIDHLGRNAESPLGEDLVWVTTRTALRVAVESAAAPPIADPAAAPSTG